MSNFTRIPDRIESAAALPGGKLVWLMTMCVVAMGFCLAHVHLRFSLAELRRETMVLQSEQGRLQSEIKGLVNQTEAIKEPRALNDYAVHELGMVPYQPAHREIVSVPEEVRTRYALARAEFSEPAAQGGENSVWFQALSEGMGMIEDARAAEAFRR